VQVAVPASLCWELVVGLLIYAIYAPVFQLGDALFKK
jgi:type II secretory pathway component PulF